MAGRTRAQKREYYFGCSLARRMLETGEAPAFIRRSAERTQAGVARSHPWWHRAAGMLWVLENDLERWLPGATPPEPPPSPPVAAPHSLMERGRTEGA